VRACACECMHVVGRGGCVDAGVGGCARAFSKVYVGLRVFVGGCVVCRCWYCRFYFYGVRHWSPSTKYISHAARQCEM